MDAKVAGPVDRVRLAVVAPFDLGPLRITPALRRVEGGGVSETLEPRVMQVLLALARPRGPVVSRDELVERCWDGRIVGDNAINRAISRLRLLAGRTNPPAFAIETVARVGYRLAPGSPARAAEVEDPAPRMPVRRDLLAAAAAGVAATGLGWWLVGREPTYRADPLAEAYHQRGLEAQRLRTYDGARQALAFFRQATEIDPDHAGAWGALALAIRNTMEFTRETELAAVAAASRSAARRALELDRDNADALTAIALVRPGFRRWAAQETACRALLRRFPEKTALAATLAATLCDVGRWRAAEAVLRPLVAREPFMPLARSELALSLWNNGRTGEADRVIEEAARFWPDHGMIWTTRFNILAFTGRHDAAIMLATIAEGSVEPRGSPIPPTLGLVIARALRSRASGDARLAVEAILAARREGSVASVQAAVHLGSLGALNAAFEVLDGYLFTGRTADGARANAPGPLTRRLTQFLFWRASRPLRRDRRFAPLARAIGLEDYWRATATRPDF